MSERVAKPGVSIEEFAGINNVQDRRRMPVGSLQVATNVDVDDLRGIRTRKGYERFGGFGAITAAYVTEDEERFFVVDDGQLKLVNTDGTSRLLKDEFGTGELYWCEAGNTIYISGNDYGVIRPDNKFIQWAIPVGSMPEVSLTSGSMIPGRYLVATCYRDKAGRQGPCSKFTAIDVEAGLRIEIKPLDGFDATVYLSGPDGETLYRIGETDYDLELSENPRLSYPLSEEQQNTQPPPEGECIAYHHAKLYVSVYIPDHDHTAIFYSQPYWHNLFDLQEDYFLIPGRVHMMNALREGIVIGTDAEIYFRSTDGLIRLADYGVPRGHAGAYTHRSEQLYFWSQRGVCKAMPFQNLTENTYQPTALDERVSSHILEERGHDRFIVVGSSGRQQEEAPV